MAFVSLSPPISTLHPVTIPSSPTIAISVFDEPISTIKCPLPYPSAPAIAIGDSNTITSLAPAFLSTFSMSFFSARPTPQPTKAMTLIFGLMSKLPGRQRDMKSLSIHTAAFSLVITPPSTVLIV